MTYNRTVTYNGEMFGTGSDIGIVALRGLEALNVELLTPDLPRYHGGLVGDSFVTPRTLELELMVRPSNRQRVLSAFQPSVSEELALEITWDDENEVDLGNRLVFCRPSRRGGPSRDRTTEFAAHRLIIELEASDPAIYSDTLDSETLTPFTSPEGISWPITWPLSWGAGGSGGGVIATNQGDFETWPDIVIHGPSSGELVDPILENVTTGLTLSLTANGGVAISSGQELAVRMHPKHRSVLFSTGASRYGRATGDFWPLAPGVNELRFRASGDTAGTTAVVEWRSAWI